MFFCKILAAQTLAFQKSEELQFRCTLCKVRHFAIQTHKQKIVPFFLGNNACKKCARTSYLKSKNCKNKFFCFPPKLAACSHAFSREKIQGFPVQYPGTAVGLSNAVLPIKIGLQWLNKDFSPGITIIGWSDSRFATVIFKQKSPFATISEKNQNPLRQVCHKLEN